METNYNIGKDFKNPIPSVNPRSSMTLFVIGVLMLACIIGFFVYKYEKERKEWLTHRNNMIEANDTRIYWEYHTREKTKIVFDNQRNYPSVTSISFYSGCTVVTPNMLRSGVSFVPFSRSWTE